MNTKFKQTHRTRNGRWVKSKPGLRLTRRGSRYCAFIPIEGEYIKLGVYKTPELAKTAYIDYLLNEQKKLMD